MTYEYFTHRINTYDKLGNLINWKSFSSKTKALAYKLHLESQHLKHVGEIELEVIRVA